MLLCRYSCKRARRCLLPPDPMAAGRRFLCVPCCRMSGSAGGGGRGLGVRVTGGLLFAFSPVLFYRRLSCFNSFSMSLRSVGVVWGRGRVDVYCGRYSWAK